MAAEALSPGLPLSPSFEQLHLAVDGPLRSGPAGARSPGGWQYHRGRRALSPEDGLRSSGPAGCGAPAGGNTTAARGRFHPRGAPVPRHRKIDFKLDQKWIGPAPLPGGGGGVASQAQVSVSSARVGISRRLRAAARRCR